MLRRTLLAAGTCFLFAAVAWAGPASNPSSKPATTTAKPAKPPTPTANKKVTNLPKKVETPAAGATAVTKKKSTNPDAKFSYAVGHNFGSQIGKSLARGKIAISPEELLRGVRDGLRGKGASPQQIRLILNQLRRKFRANMMRGRSAGASKGNIAIGKAFLANNAKKPGVITLPSGLQYKVIRPGTGPKPTATDTVVTHYRGTLINGTEFDSSYRRGRPAKFPVNGVIKGWTQALQLMRTGAKWKLFIPFNLAYGPRRAGPKIAPFSTLVFDIELLKVVGK